MSSRSPSPTHRILTSLSHNPIISYHNQTKHSFQQYAKSSKFLDWKNQPNPFRRYHGSEFISLKLIDENQWNYPSPKYSEIFSQNGMNIPVSYETMSRFLELSFGITAWKQAGQSKWSLRSNPSSGNLHPTEGFVILPSSTGFQAGLYHYCPHDHGLELRAQHEQNSSISIFEDFPMSAFFVGLTSIHWREAWKYGERAYRYCNHDIGHAIASVRIAAATLGWNALLLDGMKQTDLASLLGTSRTEEFPADELDHPETLLLVWPQTESSNTLSIPTSFCSHKLHMLSSKARWFGEATRLSDMHGDQWAIIDHVASHSWKSVETNNSISYLQSINQDSPKQSLREPNSPFSVEIIRKRRSALDFNPETSTLSQESFFQLLRRVLPHKMYTQPQDPSFESFAGGSCYLLLI